MNENNAIGKRSELYKELIDAFDCYDIQVPEAHRQRFDRCYAIIDEAQYKEICYVISQIKELEHRDPTGITEVEVLTTVAINVFAGKVTARGRFLLDLLEEARERKRPVQ